MSRRPQRCSPSRIFRSLQTLDRQPKRSPLHLPGGTRRGEGERAPRDAHSWLFPSPRRAGRLELGCGWLQTPPLERLWLQPPPPLLGAGSGCGSHPGVTAPEAPPAATRALHKSLWATRSPHPTGGSLPSHRGTQSRALAEQRRQPARQGECQDQLGQGHGLLEASELAPQPVP